MKWKVAPRPLFAVAYKWPPCDSIMERLISVLLITLLLANIVVERMEIKSNYRIWAGLLASLALAYWFPFDKIAAPPATVVAVAIIIFCFPVWFAGILFSAEFKHTASPSAALKANVLGAVIGGLLERLSLVFGLRALLLVAILLYLLAGFGLYREGTTASLDLPTVRENREHKVEHNSCRIDWPSLHS